MRVCSDKFKNSLNKILLREELKNLETIPDLETSLDFDKLTSEPEKILPENWLAIWDKLKNLILNLDNPTFYHLINDIKIVVNDILLSMPKPVEKTHDHVKGTDLAAKYVRRKLNNNTVAFLEEWEQGYGFAFNAKEKDLQSWLKNHNLCSQWAFIHHLPKLLKNAQAGKGIGDVSSLYRKHKPRQAEVSPLNLEKGENNILRTTTSQVAVENGSTKIDQGQAVEGDVQPPTKKQRMSRNEFMQAPDAIQSALSFIDSEKLNVLFEKVSRLEQENHELKEQLSHQQKLIDELQFQVDESHSTAPSNNPIPRESDDIINRQAPMLNAIGIFKPNPQNNKNNNNCKEKISYLPR
jgi:hypothetical protein